MDMINEQILAAFVRPAAFPAEAIEQAGKRRAEIAPLLIAEIEDCAAGRRAHIEGLYYLADIACHLLAEWRDTRGFKPLLSLLASPHHEMLDESITESVPSLLARLFDGDMAALQSLILSQTADEFVRDAAFDAYVLLVREGTAARADAHAFLLAFFASEPHRTGFVWNGWIDAVAQLLFEDLVPQVKQLFDKEAIDETWLDFEDFEAMLEDARRSPVDPSQLAYRSPVEEMRHWRYGDAEDDCELELGDEAIGDRVLSTFGHAPAINPFKAIGRNDPCPCGSGKKFKKCCLPKVEAGLL